jgi:hypothetical protein
MNVEGSISVDKECQIWIHGDNSKSLLDWNYIEEVDVLSSKSQVIITFAPSFKICRKLRAEVNASALIKLQRLGLFDKRKWLARQKSFTVSQFRDVLNVIGERSISGMIFGEFYPHKFYLQILLSTEHSTGWITIKIYRTDICSFHRKENKAVLKFAPTIPSLTLSDMEGIDEFINYLEHE